MTRKSFIASLIAAPLAVITGKKVALFAKKVEAPANTPRMEPICWVNVDGKWRALMQERSGALSTFVDFIDVPRTKRKFYRV